MKVLPYVYICTHKVSKEFYIGVRMANEVSAIQDLGLVYKTSSRHVRPIFDEFDYRIYAEFFCPDDAWKFEQELIREYKNDPLLINTSTYEDDSLCFHTTGRQRTDDEKKRISESKTGKKRSYAPRTRKPKSEIKCICEWCDNPFSRFFTKTDKRYYINYRLCSPKCRNTHYANNRTDEWRRKQRERFIKN